MGHFFILVASLVVNYLKQLFIVQSKMHDIQIVLYSKLTLDH